MQKTNSAKNQPFVFHECTSLIQPTGKRAQDVGQMLSLIGEVEPGVIYHHTHQYYLKAMVEIPEYSNDFAVWAAVVLEERALAEKLAGLDLNAYTTIEEIRQAIITTLKSHLADNPVPRPARKGDAFFFNDVLTIIMAVDIVVETLPDFIKALHMIGTSSIYFHFFEARMRLNRPADDFSNWLERSLGYSEAAQRIRRLDPYHYSLEGLRQQILSIIQRHAVIGS